MNGVHYLGGMQGFGAIPREVDEPVFHAEWEKVVMSINRVAGAQGIWNIDQSRWGIEQMPPADYLAASYYERWLAAQIRNLTERGIITSDELQHRAQELAANPDAPLPEPTDPALTDTLTALFKQGRSYKREGPAPAFQPGDRVATRNTHPRGHTRLPRYARGKRGIIHASHGCYVFPDTSGMGLGEHPQPLYAVEFEAAELWGDAAEPRARVYIDLWESYLQANDWGGTPA